MPTQSTTYNSRITDEALEKRFRDTFRSQGGAELVDDLYAQGVIVPVVDFTAAAEGSTLRADLQRAYDFTTGSVQLTNSTSSFITNAGFWQVKGAVNFEDTAGAQQALLQITNSGVFKTVMKIVAEPGGGVSKVNILPETVYYLRANDILFAAASADVIMNLEYRQIADVNGNLVNPSGFEFS